MSPSVVTTRMKIGTKSLFEPAAPVSGTGSNGARPVPDVARALARLIGRLDDATPDPARAAQLAILRNAVATGRYQPPLHEVARKMLAEVAAEWGR